MSLAKKATKSTLSCRSTANPRRTQLMVAPVVTVRD